jgi:DnaJ-class molecular chaperone
MIAPNKKDCPSCGGKGHILVGDNIPGANMPVPEKVECSQCHGSGLLKPPAAAAPN